MASIKTVPFSEVGEGQEFIYQGVKFRKPHVNSTTASSEKGRSVIFHAAVAVEIKCKEGTSCDMADQVLYFMFHEELSSLYAKYKNAGLSEDTMRELCDGNFLEEVERPEEIKVQVIDNESFTFVRTLEKALQYTGNFIAVEGKIRFRWQHNQGWVRMEKKKRGQF